MSADIHTNLVNLFQKLKPLGQVANVIAQTVKSVVPTLGEVKSCFYQLETSESDTKFGHCEMVMITADRFVKLGFYPTYHNVDVQSIYQVDKVNLESRYATGYEGEDELATAEDRGYQPIELKLNVCFSNQVGQSIVEWNQDNARPEDMEMLFTEANLLTQWVGKPLSSC